MNKVAYVLIGLGVIAMFTDIVSGLLFVVLGVMLYLLSKNKKSKATEKIVKDEKIPVTKLREDDSPTETTRIRLNVVGIEYEGRNKLIHSYMLKNTKLDKYGNRVLIEDNVIELRDEDNPHDPNAIAVYHTNIGKIGYVGRTTTSRVRKFFQKNQPHFIRVRFSEQEQGEYIATVRIITEVKQTS